jgi:hypothetical protein
MTEQITPAEARARKALKGVFIHDSRTKENIPAINVLMDEATNRLARILEAIQTRGYPGYPKGQGRDATEFLHQVTLYLKTGLNDANDWDRNDDGKVDGMLKRNGSEMSTLECASKQAYDYMKRHADYFFPNIDIDAQYAGVPVPNRSASQSRAPQPRAPQQQQPGSYYPPAPHQKASYQNDTVNEAFAKIKELGGNTALAHGIAVTIYNKAGAVGSLYRPEDRDNITRDAMNKFIENWEIVDNYLDGYGDGRMSGPEAQKAEDITFPPAQGGVDSLPQNPAPKPTQARGRR